MSDLENGTIIDEYEIVKILGKGAMGKVYLVKNNDEFYAVKELAELASYESQEVALKSFNREIEVLQVIEHPGLPEFYKTFKYKNKLYIVMEYIKGRSLEYIINHSEKPVEMKQALTWIIQICEVLYYLHTLNPPIIYRDIKPSNIIITDDGYARLVDFGIARRFNPDKEKDTIRLGTPGYAAPEQCSGKSQSTSRTDIYGVSVLFYQLITGYDPTSTPFKLPDVNILNPTVSEYIKNIIAKATNFDADKRYMNINLFKEDLLSYYKEKYGDFSLSYKSKDDRKEDLKFPSSGVYFPDDENTDTINYIPLKVKYKGSNVILPPPPRRVPLLLKLQNLLSGFVVLGLILLTMGMSGWMCFAYHPLREYHNFKAELLEAKGIVLSVADYPFYNKAGNKIAYVAHGITYKFTAFDNKIYEGLSYCETSDYDNNPKYRSNCPGQNEKVDVQYVKSDPSISRIIGMNTCNEGVSFPPPSHIIPFMLSIPVFCLGMILLILFTGRNLNKIFLLKFGKTGKGIVSFKEYGYTINLIKDDGNKHKIYIKTLNDKFRAGRDVAPSNLEDGSKYTFLYNPLDDENIMEISEFFISIDKNGNLEPSHSRSSYLIFICPIIILYYIFFFIYNGFY